MTTGGRFHLPELQSVLREGFYPICPRRVIVLAPGAAGDALPLGQIGAAERAVRDRWLATPLAFKSEPMPWTGGVG
jgi:hypothetical protein